MCQEEINLEKILVVSASLELQKELRDMLGGYLAIAVDNAEQAIEKLTSDKEISAVLAGIFLEETKGFDLLNYLRDNKEFYTGPVLVVTDSISDEVINRVKGYDIFDFVVRHSNENIIRTRIRNAVVYYVEKRKVLKYAVEQIYHSLNDMKILISLLAQVVEFKNAESSRHIAQVGNITKLLCKKLTEMFPEKYNFSERDIEYIALASSLHDIGKVYIPDYILNKPGKLTDEERKIMQDHSSLGAGLIERLYKFKDRPIIKYAHDICLYHHERYDGAGYPVGLAGDRIPIWAQIVSVADCYDALTNDRVYRPAYIHTAALAMIDQGECGEFNPDLIDCLWECSDKILETKTKYTTEEMSRETIYDIVSEICEVK